MDHVKAQPNSSDDMTPGTHAATAQAQRDSRVREVQDIVSRYVSQMLHGCGNTQCRQPLCDNGRKNASGRPIRRYTPRSARTIALTLATRPSPRSRLCLGSPVQNAPERNVAEGPRDPSSASQLLADTHNVKALCDAEKPHRLPDRTRLSRHVEMIRAAHQLLDGLPTSPGPSKDGLHGYLKIVDIVCEALGMLLKTIIPRPQSLEKRFEIKFALDMLAQGRAIQLRHEADKKSHDAVRHARNLLNVLEDPRRMRLFHRCLECAAPLCDIGSPIGAECFASFDRWIRARPGDADILAIFVRVEFLKQWENQTLLRKMAIPILCLLLLDACADASWAENPTGHRPGWFTVAALSDRVGVREMAESRIRFYDYPHTWRGLHLLQFPRQFAAPQRTIILRTINHLRMQGAHDDAEKASLLRGRAVPSSFEVGNDARLTFLEDHYLLLNVRRSNILTDSFNQIWQRRKGELLRPLRVRLGEMDAFEVGHDLGGVQIEFFNLLCKEIFSAELGMFKSDSTTGLSYFQPGCLQPLYMFELFGLLFVLAIYNGITLPVNFPIAFYQQLLGQPACELAWIQDAWPEMHRSLENISKQEIPGLSHAFALEANGVRLSISSFKQEPESETPKITARVAEATTIAHHPATPSPAAPSSPAATPSPSTTVDISTLDWPGWSFEPSPPSEATLEVTSDNKHEYITSYTRFLTHASVAAQWHHFLTGFHRILPPHHLTFFSPGELQTLVEGTRELSIPDLRAVTQYEGFAPDGPYMSCFWSIVKSWAPTNQRALLKFVTAAERLPAGGARNVVFKIARVGYPDADKGLPTSSTCFGTLMLPKYPNAKVLEQKLSVALEMGGEGFGTG